MNMDITNTLAQPSTEDLESEELINPKDLIIFYSWQSDLPNRTNRGLIEQALETAVKRIRQDGTIHIVPRIDKDTAGVPGSPNIASTILDKIDNSFLVVSDVSIINLAVSKDNNIRPTPNPNVLYELGYAVKSLGIKNVVLVQNTAFGDQQYLPFDLRLNRVLTYECDASSGTTQARNELARKLEGAVRLAVEHTQQPVTQSISIVEKFQELISSGQTIMVIEARLKNVIDRTIDDLSSTGLYNYNDAVSAEAFTSRTHTIEALMRDLIDIYFLFGRWANQSQIGAIIRQFDRLVTIPYQSQYMEIWENLARYPALLTFYAMGLGALYNENIDALTALLSVTSYNRYTNENEPMVARTNVGRVLNQYREVTKDNRYVPGSDDLFKLFHPYCSDVAETKYEDIFDSFDYLVSLKYAAWKMKDGDIRVGVPGASYRWRTMRRKIWDIISADFKRAGENWLYFRCFGLDRARLQQVVETTNQYLEANIYY